MTERNIEYGRFEFEDGSIYEGNFITTNGDKIKQGRGTLTFSSNSALETRFEKYIGEWHQDQMEGFGEYHYISGAIYKGFWRQNQHWGKGRYEFPDGAVYEGDWERHLMHGEGIFTSPDGRQSWRGEFRDGVFSSKMQNELRTEKRVEMKKKSAMAENEAFLRRVGEMLEGDKKGLKDGVKRLFAINQNEEVKFYFHLKKI